MFVKLYCNVLYSNIWLRFSRQNENKIKIKLTFTKEKSAKYYTEISSYVSHIAT